MIILNLPITSHRITLIPLQQLQNTQLKKFVLSSSF
jgi:hypothetical protein